MKRVISLIKFDITNALRDSLVIYVLIAPILLAVGLRLFLPNVQGSVLTFAVQVPTSVTQLSQVLSAEEKQTLLSQAEQFARSVSDYGTVERYETAEEVRERVARTDSTGGFALTESGDWSIILEGDEEGEPEAIMQSVFSAGIRGGLAAEYTVNQIQTRSPVREYASVGLVMLASLIGGVAVAFAMVDEKEQNVTRAFTVTPLTPLGYFLARGLLAAVIGYFVASVGHLILVGTSVPIDRFLIALAAAAPLPLLAALLVGGISKNQIQAVASLKVVMLAYLTLPFASIAVPRGWHWLFYLFPNYWMFRSFEGIYVTGSRVGDLPLAAGATLVTGLAVLVALGFALRRQLKPR